MTSPGGPYPPTGHPVVFWCLGNESEGELSNLASAFQQLSRRARNDLWLLRVFAVFRLILALVFALLFFTKTGPALLGQTSPSLFALTAIGYLGFTAAGGVLISQGSGVSIQNHAFIMVFVDTVAITLLMHASGGVISGLGIIIAISLAFGSLLTRERIPLLIAALGSLSILTEQVYSDLSNVFEQTAYTQSGLLGVLYFAIAFLASIFAQRLQQSQREIHRREIDLANMQQLNEYVIQHMLTGIVVADAEGRVRMMNESAWDMLGQPVLNTDEPLQRVSPKLAEQVTQWKEDKTFQRVPFRPHSEGRELKAGFSSLGDGGDAGTVIFLEDASILNQQAQQMKLASLGRLTASIAHEIRNPLSSISHAGQLLAESQDLPPGDRRLTEIISKNTRRVNGIIETVLQLARRDRSNPRVLDLTRLTDEIVSDTVARHPRLRDQIATHIEPPHISVYADPQQLSQVLVNLCENAINHFDKDRGSLSLQIRGGLTREYGGPFLEVIDNGAGIPPDVARQMFEPFYTTSNTGTGLGLYIARELCETNRVRLEYCEGVSGGSCFRLNFPGVRREFEVNPET